MLDTRKTVKVGGEVGSGERGDGGGRFVILLPVVGSGVRKGRGRGKSRRWLLLVILVIRRMLMIRRMPVRMVVGVSGESKLAGVVNELEARLRAAQVRLDKTQKIRRRVQENSKKQGKLGMQEREAVKRLSKEQREALGQIEVQARVVEELEGVCTLVRAALDDERRGFCSGCSVCCG